MAFGRNCNSFLFSSSSKLPIVRAPGRRPLRETHLFATCRDGILVVWLSSRRSYTACGLFCIKYNSLCVVYEYRVYLTWFSLDIHRYGSQRRCARLTTWLHFHDILRAVTRVRHFISGELSPIYMVSWMRTFRSKNFRIMCLGNVIYFT